MAEPAPLKESPPPAFGWSAADIARGWVFGAVAMLVLVIAWSVVVWSVLAPVAIQVAAVYGLAALTLYGVPVAIGTAALLRRVRWLWVHLAVFALLGAGGGAVVAQHVATWVERGELLAPQLGLIGAVTAVTARWGAQAYAARRDRRAD